MKVLPYASLVILIYSAFFTSMSLANTEQKARSDSDDSFNSVSAGTTFTAEMRRTIKREVMSQPGVLLDMANMTDNGYAWTNDVVWAGSSASAEETQTGTNAQKNLQWYIAGFMFERPQHKGVWLQYAFTLSEFNGEIANFRRWYGNATFR